MTPDPVLAAIRAARHRRDEADLELRLLIAYAREVHAPRPYRLADLASAAAMSISGVRTAYTRADVQDVHARLAS
jgi:AraC-like DNA-binding protein